MGRFGSLQRAGALALVAAPLVLAAGSPSSAQQLDLPLGSSTESGKAAEAFIIAKNAYIYGYSLITSEITRVQMTNVAKVEGLHGPMGQFIPVKRYPPADYRGVTAPNADTLYTAAWVDVGSEPWVMSWPNMGDRYYLFSTYSLWMPVIASPGKRTTGGGAQAYAITGPSWHGQLPAGLKEIKSPTRYALILSRTYCLGTPEDYAAVNALQDQYKLYPLSSWDKTYTPLAPTVDPNPGFSMTDKVRDVIKKMDTATYFKMLARLLKENPPPPEDGEMVAAMAKIGIVPGRDFDLSKLSPETQNALQDVGKASYAEIVGYFNVAGKIENGWLYTKLTGRYGTNYLDRALIADVGWPANLPQDAIYPTTKVDSTGQTLSGTKNYTIHFERGRTPPADGFWSITMYDAEYFFIQNPLNKQTVSPRNNLKYNPDGSLDLYFQHESPGAEKEANWLPAPAGDFILMMRIYWPQETPPSIIDGTWVVPPVVRVGG